MTRSRSEHMEDLVERLRDTRTRIRLGLKIDVELDALLDSAADELEEAAVDVSLCEGRGLA